MHLREALGRSGAGLFLLIACALCGPAYGQQKAPQKPRSMSSIYIVPPDAKTRKSMTTIRAEDVVLLINVLDARQRNDAVGMESLLKKSHSDLARFDLLLSDVTCALIATTLDRANKQFSSGSGDVFEESGVNLRVAKADYPKLRRAIDSQVVSAYQDRGGVEQFRKNQQTILAFEKDLWPRLWPLLELSKK
jgi:hypothetical protein